MSCTTIAESIQRARKAHRCSWCGQPIPVGEVYLRTRFVFEGDPGSNKFHMECEKAAADDYAEWGEGFMPYENERPAKVAQSETACGEKGGAMSEKDHYKFGLSGDKVDVEVAERLRAQIRTQMDRIRELESENDDHWQWRRRMGAEAEADHARISNLEAALSEVLDKGEMEYVLGAELTSKIEKLLSSAVDGGVDHGS